MFHAELAVLPRRLGVRSLRVLHLAGSGGAASARDVNEEQVRRAIERGVDYLKSTQLEGGGWGEHPGEPGGATSLCLLALLNSGVPVSDPTVQRGLAYLRQPGLDPQRTYSVSLMLMVLAMAEPERDRPLIQRCATWLQDAQTIQGRQAGAWSYSGRSEGSGDSSNAQFALLALYEAEQLGIAVRGDVWTLARDYWRSLQNDDGSWGYRQREPDPSGSMTCAGLSSTIIANGRLNPPEASIVNGKVQCCGPVSVEPYLDKGLQWLGDRFSVDRNPSGGASTYYYYMYGMERVGRLSGQRFIGRRDWYREGADALVRRQDKLNGSWVGLTFSTHVETSFALLFLSKGRRPVVLSRVKHGEGQDWNRHRAGMPHLVRRVEQSWKMTLTWQTIDLAASTTEDLLMSPVLLLSGSEALQLTAEQKQQLRDYVNQGGFLFCEGLVGCGCDGQAFDASLKALLAELFPDSPLRRLPPDHAAWFADAAIRPDDLPEDLWLYGVDACCRTSVIYCPHPLSGYWELDQPRQMKEYPESVRAQVEACSVLGQNILAYATNRQLKGKLERPNVAVSEPNSGRSRGVLQIPKLAHGGGSDDAPNALRNLLQLAGAALEMRINSDTPLINATDENLYRYPILFMHGRRTFSFSASERKALCTYLQRGGFSDRRFDLRQSAICAVGAPRIAGCLARTGIPPLAERSSAADARVSRLRPQHRHAPRSSEAFASERAGGVSLDSNGAHPGGALRRRSAGGRAQPLRSQLHLENQSSLECKGYIRDDAAKIGINVVLFALQQ